MSSVRRPVTDHPQIEAESGYTGVVQHPALTLFRGAGSVQTGGGGGGGQDRQSYGGLHLPKEPLLSAESNSGIRMHPPSSRLH